MNYSIPKEWTSDRLKDVSAINASSLPANTDADYEFHYLEISNVDYFGIVDSQAIERLRYEDAPSRARRRLAKNCTAISSVRPNLQAVAFIEDARDDLVCSTGFNVVRPAAHKLFPKFAYYSLLADGARQYFEATAKGVGYPAVDDKDFQSFRVPLPPLPEQRRIAAYLDASCAAIDAAVADKRRQLETLDALRKTTIHRAVTQGLNPEVKMKSAGANWLSNVPAHWEVDRIRDRLERIVGGEWGDDPDAHEEGVLLPVIRVADIRGLDLVVEGLTIRRIKESKLSGRLIGKRTILLEKSGGGEQNPVGRAVRTSSIDFDAICSNFMAKIDCGDTANTNFVVYLLDAMYSTNVNVSCIQQTTGIQNLRVTDYLNTKVGFPPLSEQQMIVSHLDAMEKNVEALLKIIESQITTLTAYRKSLIHECVTGQRRITDADINRAKAHA